MNGPERISAQRASIELWRTTSETGDPQAALVFLFILAPTDLRQLRLHADKILTAWRVEAARAFLASNRQVEQTHLCRDMEDRRALCGAEPPPGYEWSFRPYDDEGLDGLWLEMFWSGVDEDDIPEGGLVCAVCRDLYAALEAGHGQP